MFTFLVIIHVLVCIFLIGIVLLQGGRGAELGSTFGGGSSQTLFGARGAATILGKITTVMAIIFMFSSLLLTIFSFKQTSVNKSIIPEETVLPNKVAPVKKEVEKQTLPERKSSSEKKGENKKVN